MVNLSIAFFWALEPARVSVPLPQEIDEVDEADAPAEDEVLPLAVGVLLFEPQAERAAAAMKPAPATAAYRWSFTGEVPSL